MFERRVVITGMGVVSCAGNSISEFWGHISRGKSGISTISKFQNSLSPVKIAGEVRGLTLENFPKKEERRLDDFTRFAIAAADEAMKQSGLPEPCSANAIDSIRFGVTVSSGAGGLQLYDKNLNALKENGSSYVSPFFIPIFISNNASGVLAKRYQAHGTNFNIASACASGTHAIGEASWIIKRGDADIMLAGGTEACITELITSGFTQLTALSTSNDIPEAASRPFSADRDGFVIAEGAAVLVLEEYEHARRRGVPILAELAGYGASSDAYHATSPLPDGSGLAAAIRSAVFRANCRLDEIGHIQAHGTATVSNDRCEAKAIQSVFGNITKQIAVSSIKSMIGHAIAASGPMSAVSCIQTLRTGIVPPTINYHQPDPECDINATPNYPGKTDKMYAMANSMGFGGHNAVLIFKKWES